jgi:hypothetical protein
MNCIVNDNKKDNAMSEKIRASFTIEKETLRTLQAIGATNVVKGTKEITATLPKNWTKEQAEAHILLSTKLG